MIGTADPAGHARIVARVLLLAAAAVIVLKVLFDTNGYLSPDSTNYLALVENLRTGHGLVIANDGRVDAAYTPFAEWPAGYPLLIYGTAKLTGLSSFAASKLVSILLFFASATVIARAFPRHGWVLACVLCLGATVEVFAYTWSEVPFTFGLIVLAVLTARLLRGDRSRSATNALLLFACASWLFLSRYIGAFAIGQIGLLAAIEVRRRRYRSALLLATAGAAVVALTVGCLWWNWLQTGHATGMTRPQATTPTVVLLRQLFAAVAGELAVVVPPHSVLLWAEWGLAALFIAAFAILALRTRPRGDHSRAQSLEALAFLWVGAIYLLAIVAMRWLKEFDPFDFRLLDPAFVLLFVGAFALLLGRNAPAGRALVLGLAAVSLIAHTVVALRLYDGQGYLAHAREVEQRYAQVPRGATVVFGDRLARFLRPDLHIDAPCSEQGEDCSASWDDYLDDLAEGRPIYVDINEEALDPDHHSPSVRAFVAGHRPGELLRVR